LDGLPLDWISKKGEDFKDFKVICSALYKGAHKDENLKNLILKLSLTMNNYRLSTSTKPLELLSELEMKTLVDSAPLVSQLSDGRQRDLVTGKILHQHSSCIYEIIKSDKETIKLKTLGEASEVIGVNIKSLSKYLEDKESVEVKGNLVRRVPVFIKEHKNL
jgi:hypothetical protein